MAPLYKDFKEFVIDLGNKEARNMDTHDAAAAQLKRLEDKTADMEKICATKQVLKDATDIERELRSRIDDKFKDSLES